MGQNSCQQGPSITAPSQVCKTEKLCIRSSIGMYASEDAATTWTTINATVVIAGTMPAAKVRAVSSRCDQTTTKAAAVVSRGSTCCVSGHLAAGCWQEQTRCTSQGCVACKSGCSDGSSGKSGSRSSVERPHQKDVALPKIRDCIPAGRRAALLTNNQEAQALLVPAGPA